MTDYREPHHLNVWVQPSKTGNRLQHRTTDDTQGNYLVHCLSPAFFKTSHAARCMPRRALPCDAGGARGRVLHPSSPLPRTIGPSLGTRCCRPISFLGGAAHPSAAMNWTLSSPCRFRGSEDSSDSLVPSCDKSKVRPCATR